jgi:SAM-dependent methyltransferase
MAKQGEIEYFSNLDEGEKRHAAGMPFSDVGCGSFLMEIGAVMGLLPPVPARLLDMGCGTGWTSRFFARRGYEVVGVDIAPDMIRTATSLTECEGLANLRFAVGDYETFRPDGEFDCAVFYSSLHHAINEEDALRTVYQALRPQGICVIAEPGKGHAGMPYSQRAVERCNVTERDMPPGRVRVVAKKIGFRKFQAFPHAFDIHTIIYPGRRRFGWLARPRWLVNMLNAIRLVRTTVFRLQSTGIVRIVK